MAASGAELRDPGSLTLSSNRSAAGTRAIVIRPARGWIRFGLGDVLEYRELLFFLIWRDIKVRYKQTLLGVAWAVIQPVLAMLIFSVFFGKLAGVPSDNVPYPIFALTGLLPWQLFSYALTQSSNSVVANKNLVTKVYFPRLVVPLSATLSGLLDFAISFAVLLVMLGYYRIPLTSALFAVPLVVIFAVLSALAVGLWFSALNVRYRDVQFTIPFLTQFWLFATPIAYPSSLVPLKWRALYGLNPMAGVVESFRWALLGQPPASPGLIAVSMGIVVLGLIGGIAFFQRVERSFADLV